VNLAEREVTAKDTQSITRRDRDGLPPKQSTYKLLDKN